ncbi:MAG TPA: hypothetical protein DCS30_18925 [Rhizobiales bacterium]|nr:hypothetical protein [Hyphomicrobiales bacterium]
MSDIIGKFIGKCLEAFFKKKGKDKRPYVQVLQFWCILKPQYFKYRQKRNFWIYLTKKRNSYSFRSTDKAHQLFQFRLIKTVRPIT